MWVWQILGHNKNGCVYANDTFGNFAASQTLDFTVAVPPKSSPILAFVAVTATLSAVIVAIAVVVHRKHRSKT